MSTARVASFLGQQLFKATPVYGTMQSASDLLNTAARHGFASETFTSARKAATETFADLHEFIPGVKNAKSSFENSMREHTAAGLNLAYNAASPTGATIFQLMLGAMPAMNMYNPTKR